MSHIQAFDLRYNRYCGTLEKNTYGEAYGFI